GRGYKIYFGANENLFKEEEGKILESDANAKVVNVGNSDGYVGGRYIFVDFTGDYKEETDKGIYYIAEWEKGTLVNTLKRSLVSTNDGKTWNYNEGSGIIGQINSVLNGDQFVMDDKNIENYEFKNTKPNDNKKSTVTIYKKLYFEKLC
ncbi:MAG: hypothetical protein SO085_01135, partial [Eubacteriales bacterium]|nr:hypothetical protein [Eubacteriales bacterium]